MAEQSAEEPKKSRFKVRNLGRDEDGEDSIMESQLPAILPQSELPVIVPKKSSRFTVTQVNPKSCDTTLLHNGLSSIISQLQSLLQEIPRTGGKNTKRRKAFRNKRTQHRRRR